MRRYSRSDFTNDLEPQALHLAYSEGGEKRDAAHIILSALIQYGDPRPRGRLSEAEITERLAAFRPDMPTWPRVSSGVRSSNPLCGTCGRTARRKSVAPLTELWYCRHCHSAWRAPRKDVA